jgi:hypothetical protein
MQYTISPYLVQKRQDSGFPYNPEANVTVQHWRAAIRSRVPQPENAPFWPVSLLPCTLIRARKRRTPVFPGVYPNDLSPKLHPAYLAIIRNPDLIDTHRNIAAGRCGPMQRAMGLKEWAGEGSIKPGSFSVIKTKSQTECIKCG